MPSLGRRQFCPNKEQNDRAETCCTSFVALIETEVENDSALDREPNADTALMAVNGSEPTVDLVDAERSCSARTGVKGLVREPAVGFEPTTC